MKIKPTMMASILHSDSSASFDKSQFHHTIPYSEENVYLLCKKLCAAGVADLSDLFVVFISNEIKRTILWHQKVKDEAVMRKYHVICIQRKKEGKYEDLVWDLDSTLPSFPSTLASYVSESVKPSVDMFPELKRVFRVVHAPLFLAHFASDRRHDKDHMGNRIMPPPEYKPIVAQGH